MKQAIIVVTMLLTLGLKAGASAQQHRHHQPAAVLADTAAHDAIEAYSDTTSAALPGLADDAWEQDDDATGSHGTRVMTMNRLLDGIDADDVAGMLFVLGVLLILFVLAPVLIIIVLFYFINKNRKQRLQMAQMALQNGQPIPDGLLNSGAGDDVTTEDYQRGMRQCFVGVGLAIFLGLAAGGWGFGVGALVFFIGLGKVVAAKTSRKSQPNTNNTFTNEL